MAAKGLFIDSHLHYDSAALMALKYVSIAGSNATWSRPSTGGPTNGPHILRQANSGTAGLGDYIVPRLQRNQAGAHTPTVAGLIGFWLKVDDLSKIQTGDANNLRVFALWDDSAEMLRFNLSPAGAFSVWRVDNPISFTELGGGSGAGTVVSDVWAHVQLKYDLRNSNGRVQVRVDRTTHIDSGLTDTLGAGTAPDAIRLLPMTAVDSALALRICSPFVISLDAFTDQYKGQDWLDDRIAGCLFPIANGASVGWTPSAGQNWQNVDDAPPDDDTTTNEATAVDTLDLYEMEDLPVGVTPDMLQAVAYIKRDTGASAGIEPAVRHSSTTVKEVGQGIAQDVYQYILHPMDDDPVAAAAWTEANVNAAEFGLNKV